MIYFTDATGLLGCALALVAAGSKLPGVSRMARVLRAGVLAGLFVVALLPLGELPLAAYVRGAVGDLSIPTLVLLVAALSHALRGSPVLPDRAALLFLIVFLAVGLYPMALGWGDFDPYRLGYGSPWLLASLLGLALLSVWRGWAAIALVIALAVLAWSAGWYESTNLWDYLLDPLVSIYAVVALIMQATRRRRAA